MSARQLQKSIGFVFVLILVPKPCERCQIFPLRAEESNCKLLSVCKLHETIVMPLQRCPAICSPLRESLFVVEQTSALCFRVCQYIAQQSRLVRLNPGSRYPVIDSSHGYLVSSTEVNRSRAELNLNRTNNDCRVPTY